MKPTRAAMLQAAVLVGLSVTEALACAPGLIYDMCTLRAMNREAGHCECEG